MSGRGNGDAVILPSREAEIAEVLAAIRRITEDAMASGGPPAAPAQAPAADPAPSHQEQAEGSPTPPPVADPLVLSPALRLGTEAPARLDLREPVEESRDEEAPPAGEAVPEQDDEVLREIVAEIVRQELRGELGQDITRSIRKLVLREINHLMATRDLR